MFNNTSRSVINTVFEPCLNIAAKIANKFAEYDMLWEHENIAMFCRPT